MKRNFLQVKLLVTALVIGLSFVAAAIPPVVQHVAAAGETYTYTDSDNITMRGATVGSINLKRSGFEISSNQFIGGGIYNNKCTFTITLTAAGDGKSGTLAARGVREQGGDKPECGAADLNQYNGKTVTVQGDAGDEETAEQKGVTVAVFLPKDAVEKPGSMKLTITDKAGKELTSVNAKRTNMEDGTAAYQAVFSVGPDADYKACAGPPLDKCEAFHKNKHEKKLITFGETTDVREITVTIKVTGVRSAGESYTLGPADVTWELAKGGNKQTVQTDSKDIAAIEPGASAVGNVESTLTAKISPIDPGKYKICVPAINQCKEVEKREFANAGVEFNAANKLDAFQNTGEDDAKPSCDLGFWAISYIACPVSSAMGPASLKMNTMIREKLTFDIKTFFDTSKEPGASYKAISNIMRTFALSIIVLAAVIMLAAEAAGVPIVSAYALRAGLPRLLIGSLAIIVSWELAKDVTLAVNNIGTWGSDLMLQPFRDAGFLGTSAEVTVLGSLAQTGAIVAALIFLGPLGALMGLGLVFAAFGVAYLVLTIWQWLMIFFIITLPFWIALGSFKGTDKGWGVFKKNAGGLLLVQVGAPMILALGTIGGAVAKKAGGDTAGMTQVIAAVFALMGVIALFVNRGGALGIVAGGARSFSKKYISGRGGAALKKRGSARMAERSERLKTGNYAPAWTGRLGQAFNNGTRGAYGMRNAGYNPAQFKRQWKEARSQDAVQRSGQLMQSAQWKAIANNDNAMRAASASSESAAESDIIQTLTKDGKVSYADAQAQARSAISTVKASGMRIGEKGLRVAGFKQMAANGSAIPNLESAMDTITDIAGDDASTRAELVGGLKAAAGARPDMGGASFGSIYGLATKRARGETTDKDFRDVKVESARNTAAHQLLGAKEGAIRQVGEALAEDMQYHVDAASASASNPAVAAQHRQKANENLVIQNRLMQGGAYAGVTGVAAIYDTTNRVQDVAGNAHPDTRSRAAVQGNISLGTPMAPANVTLPDGRVVPGSAPNPAHDPTSPLNEEARRFQALSGMPQNNLQEHEIRTGGGGS